MVDRFQVTFTDDARRQKVITFGGSPLVNWYAYLRDGQGGRLYLQREVDGTLEPEILVIEANDPGVGKVDSRGVTWFDFVEDPNDSTQAHLYWLADGTLWRVTVTSTPIGEAPTTQQFDRVNNRYENLPTPWFSTTPFESFQTRTNTPIPGIVIVQTLDPAFHDLIITVPPAAADIFEPDVIELYRLPNGGDGALYLSTPLPGSRQIVVNVVANAVTFTKWAVRSVRSRPQLRSQFASIIDDGNFDTSAVKESWASTTPFEAFFRKVPRQPIKKTLAEPDLDAPWGSTTPFEAFMTKLSRQPIKNTLEEPAITSPWASTTPFEAFFRKN